MSAKSANLSAIELLKRANQGAILEAVFQIPAGDDTFIDAKLTAPDVVEIWQESDLQRTALWAKAQEAGLVGKPVDEAKWQAEFERYKSSEGVKQEDIDAYADKKPKDLAEQYANEHAGINTVRNIIPRYLKNLDNTHLLPTEQDREDFRRIMARNSDIFKAISDIYVSLSRQIAAEKETVKNS